MKTTLTGGGVLALAGVSVLAVAGLWLYSKRGAIAKGAERAVAAVNPADSRNVVNSAVTAVGEAVTGDKAWTLGGQFAEWFSPSVRAANDMIKAPATTKGNAASYDETARLLARYSAPEAAPAHGEYYYGWGVGS